MLVEPQLARGNKETKQKLKGRQEVRGRRREREGGEGKKEKKMEKVFIRSGTAEVGANGGFKSFAIERRRFSLLAVLFLSRRLAGSRRIEEQPVDQLLQT